MKKYVVLLIVLMSMFGTMSAHFDSFGQPQPEQQVTLGTEGDFSYDKVGFGCASDGHEL